MRLSAFFKRLTASLARALTRPVRTPLKIVAWRPLHAGAALYVADIDGRRLVFATAPNAVGLLLSYRSAPLAREEEQATAGV